MAKKLLAVFGAVLVAAVPPAEAKVSPQTLDNLNAAFQGESNAAHRYDAFAKQADGEGRAYVARLFRAASKAEAVHRENHKYAILALGGKVKDFKLDEVKTGATTDNLQAAIKGESHEWDTMYPAFLAVAKKDEAKDAVRTLLYAEKAEGEHARLFKNALENLDKNADGPIYFCKMCGHTTAKLPAANCPSCREAVRNFERIP
jgi:rubrerythrin